MIVKVLTRHNPTFRSLISYILNDGKAIDGKVHVMTHNVRSKDKNGYLREFIQNEVSRKYRRDGQIFMYHEILSLSKEENKDTITREKLEDLTREYFKLRGLDSMCLAAIHEDTGHAHVHIMTSGVKYRTGLANRISHQHLRDIKEQLQIYHQEKYPELSKSNVNHGLGTYSPTDKEWRKANRDKRISVKETVIQKVQECFNAAQSKADFLTKLQNANLHYYERAGRIEGVVSSEGLKFRFSRMDIDLTQLRETEKEITEEQKISQFIETKKQKKNMENNPDKLYLHYALWHFVTGGEPKYDPISGTYSLTTNDNRILPIAQSTYDQMLSMPVSPELQEIREIKEQFATLRQSQELSNEEIGELLEKGQTSTKFIDDVALSMRMDELMVIAESNFFFDLDIDEEVELMHEITRLQANPSNSFEVQTDSPMLKEKKSLDDFENGRSENDVVPNLEEDKDHLEVIELDENTPPFTIVSLSNQEKNAKDIDSMTPDDDYLEPDDDIYEEREPNQDDHDYDDHDW